MSNERFDTARERYRGLAPDLWPRRLRSAVREEEYQERNIPPEYTGNAMMVGKGFLGRALIITTVPSLMIRAEYAWPYIILNPSNPLAAGDALSTSIIHASAAEVAAGNTQALSVIATAYRNAHLHLIVTAVTGTWDFYEQSLDPATLNWTDVQRIYTAITATGNYYASVGTLGVVQSMAVRWDPVVAGSITFALSLSLKDPIYSGAASGIDKTIYLGPNSDINTTIGYPVLEGKERELIVGEGVEIWGVAGAPVEIRIFEV